MNWLARCFRCVPDLIWLVFIMLTGFIVRIAGLADQGLWLDEAFSWLVASRSLTAGLQIALENFVHPPFYYLLLHPVTQLDQGEFVLRFPSVLLGLFGIPVMYRLGRALPGDPSHRHQVGLLTAALLAVNPFHVWFSREARNYELVFLLSALVLYTFQQLLKDKDGWGAFIVVSALAYVTHYFTLLLAFAQFIYFLLRFRHRYRLFRRWVLTQALAFIPLAAWLAALFSQEYKSIGIGWIPRPTLLTPLLTFANFALLYVEHWLPWGIAVLPLFAIAIACGFRSPQRRVLLAVWLAVPCFSVLVISWTLGRYLYVDRYFIIGLPAFVLLLARGIAVFPRHTPYRKWLAGSAAALLLAASTLSVIQIHQDPALGKVDWRSVGSVLTAKYREGDRVVLRIVEATVPLHYYSSGIDWTYATDRPEPDPWPEIERGCRRLWLVWDNPYGSSNHLPVATEPFDIYTEADSATVAWLVEHRKEIVEEWNYRGLTMLLVNLVP